MNLQQEIQALSEELVLVTDESYRDDIESVLYDQLDYILKDYALLRAIPFGDDHEKD